MLLRVSGLENTVWDDYQEWLTYEGAGLLFLFASLPFSPSLPLPLSATPLPSPGERAILNSIQATWPGLRRREAGRWHCRMEKLLADGTDYLSNKDTFGSQC